VAVDTLIPAAAPPLDNFLLRLGFCLCCNLSFAPYKSALLSGEMNYDLEFSGKGIRRKLLDDVKVTQWIVNNYSGKLEKVLSGELLLRPWEGLL